MALWNVPGQNPSTPVKSAVLFKASDALQTLPLQSDSAIITRSLDHITHSMSSTALEMKAYRPPESRSGTITSWIPLITPYSMFADGCPSAFLGQADGDSIIGWDPAYGISIDKNMRCMPEAVTAWWDQDRLGPNSETVTSIGPLICPEPFKQVHTLGDASSTRVACCPPDYTFASWADKGKPVQCYSVVGSGTAITYYTKNNAQRWGANSLTTNTTTTVSAVHINGWVFAEETGSPECTTMVSNNSSATGDGALSNGNKIGIGIGVGMGIVGLATLAAGLFMMRRARRFHHPRHQQEQQQQQQQATQKDGPGWYSASAHPGAHRDSAAVGDRYVAPPTELSST